MRDSIRTKNCRYKKPFTITSDSKIYKNQKINLDKTQKLGDGITFVLNCDFVCDIVNAEEMKTFPKCWILRIAVVGKSILIFECSVLVKQNV